MPLITTSHDSLPYIDPPPSPTARTAASALIASEQSVPPPPGPHPSMRPLTLPAPTPAMAAEYARLEAHPAKPITGIDLSRYEELSAPLPGASTQDPWLSTLSQAYTSQTYLRHRLDALAELDAHGKEAWLASNDHLVSLLAALERELAAAKEAIDRTVLERQAAQEAVKGEMLLLEKAWKEGVGRVLETELAAEGLRGEVLGRRRGVGN